MLIQLKSKNHFKNYPLGNIPDECCGKSYKIHEIIDNVLSFISFIFNGREIIIFKDDCELI